MSSKSPKPRKPLTRDRILRAAVELADQEGLSALTMRRLGAQLGVEAMSLYKHVANKDEILDGIVELIVSEIHIPIEGAGWKESMRKRAVSAREVFSAHSWAIGLLETRGSSGPASLRYLNAILGTLRSGGFSVENAAHAFWLLDSYVYGQVVQEATLNFNSSGDMAEPSGPPFGMDALDEYPHLVEIGAHAATHNYSVDRAFSYGLEMILDALERAPK